MSIGELNPSEEKVLKKIIENDKSQSGEFNYVGVVEGILDSDIKHICNELEIKKFVRCAHCGGGACVKLEEKGKQYFINKEKREREEKAKQGLCYLVRHHRWRIVGHILYLVASAGLGSLITWLLMR